MHGFLDIEAILAGDPARRPVEGQVIGHSRQGRSIRAFDLGSGPIRISLIGGCHADEPVGPAMLEKLATHLGTLAPTHPLLVEMRWQIVPHVNLDGAAVNALWSDLTLPSTDHLGAGDEAYDLVAYAFLVIAMMTTPGRRTWQWPAFCEPEALSICTPASMAWALPRAPGFSSSLPGSIARRRCETPSANL